MKKKVILFIYSNPLLYPPTINAATILIEKGYDVYVVGFFFEIPGDIYVNDNVRLINFGHTHDGLIGILNFVKCHVLLMRLCIRTKPFRIISYDTFASVVTGNVAKMLKIKWIYYQHDFWDDPVGIWQKIVFQYERRIVKNADFWCFPQIQRAQIYKSLVGGNKKIIIVHNGPRLGSHNLMLDPNILIQGLRNRFKYILIYQGGWSFDYRLDYIIRMMPFIMSDCCLLLLGKEHEPGVLKSLHSLAENLNVSERVIFHDRYIKYDDLQSVTNFCDIGITIPLKDNDTQKVNLKYLAGASNKACEYANASLHILVSNAYANVEFYKDYPIVTYCNPDNSMECAEKINCLLKDEVALQRKKNRSKYYFDNFLNFDLQFEKLLNEL